jgi:hypothetical protein
MKINPALLGVFLALSFTTTLVASQETIEPLLCESHSDCPTGRDGSFCASDGICETIGGCAVPDDCFLDANQGYAVALCFGEMECNERTCGMNCSGGSDALFGCMTSDDCFEPGNYCTTNGICRPGGACFDAADCNMSDNLFMAIECVGKFFCDNNTCGKECGGFPEEPVMSLPEPFAGCTTSADCPGEMEFCAGNDTCLPFGGCDREGDCINPDNEIMMIACVGTVTCDAGGMCGKICDTLQMKEPVATVFPEVPAVSIDVLQCRSDADCITTSTTRAAVDADSYCAQGVCTKQGSCFVDEDCINPSNVLFSDKKCMGYLHCTEMGMCDRVCGEMCKNGSRSVECFANPCDTQALCEWAVSCQMTTCDGACNALYFSSDGEGFSCDSDSDGNMENTKADGPEMDTEKDDTKEAAAGDLTEVGLDPQVANLASSAVFRGTSSYFALLVAVLAAAAIV